MVRQMIGPPGKPEAQSLMWSHRCKKIPEEDILGLRATNIYWNPVAEACDECGATEPTLPEWLLSSDYFEASRILRKGGSSVPAMKTCEATSKNGKRCQNLGDLRTRGLYCWTHAKRLLKEWQAAVASALSTPHSDSPKLKTGEPDGGSGNVENAPSSGESPAGLVGSPESFSKLAGVDA